MQKLNLDSFDDDSGDDAARAADRGRRVERNRCARTKRSSRNESHSRERRRNRLSDRKKDKKSLGFIETVSQRVVAWRTLRNESRIRVLLGLAMLDNSLAPYVLPNDDEEKSAWVEFLLYITKPKALCLAKDAFFVTVSANRKVDYSAVVRIRISPLSGEGSPDVLRAKDEVPMGMPNPVPDPSSEVFPYTEIYRLDIDELGNVCPPPDDPYDCIMLSVGAWWHRPSRRIYYLRLDKPILAVCPAGWKIRTVGAALAKLLNHKEGCDTCSWEGKHIDAYNAMWIGKHSTEGFSSTCVCKAPCLWRKAAVKEIPVCGDPALCQAFFIAPVKAVRVVSCVSNPRITGRLDEVISAGGGGRRVPVNCSAWQLVHLPETWSNVMVSGCTHLCRLLKST